MAATETQTERNKAVIRRFVEEVQNQKNWDVYDELNDPDFVNHSAPPGMTDREGSKQYLGAFLNGFPDCKFTIDDMVAEADQVVTKKTFHGTHTAEFAGIPPTGKEVTLQFADIMRVRDGRITEHWLSMDQLSFMHREGSYEALKRTAPPSWAGLSLVSGARRGGCTRGLRLTLLVSEANQASRCRSDRDCIGRESSSQRCPTRLGRAQTRQRLTSVKVPVCQALPIPPLVVEIRPSRV